MTESKKSANKISYIKFLFSFLASSVVIVIAVFILNGPLLLPHFDFLSLKLFSPPIANEIIIIDTGEQAALLDQNTFASILQILHEKNAKTLLVQIPILGLSASSSDRRRELTESFEREFRIIKNNITSLFDGIKKGSIPPENANFFVESLLELTESGQERLTSETLYRYIEDAARLEEALTVFNNVYIAADTSFDMANAYEYLDNNVSGALNKKHENKNIYSASQPDKDGKLRRIIALTENAEHIAAASLENHFYYSIEETRFSKTLVLENKEKERLEDFEKKDLLFSLDNNGAIIIQHLPPAQNFRILKLADFIDYEKYLAEIEEILTKTEELAFYGSVHPQDYPLYAKNNALATNNEYIESLHNFFNSAQTEINIEKKIDDLAYEAGIPLEENETLLLLREKLLNAFYAGQDAYKKLAAVNAKLSALNGAFGILGSVGKDAYSSALLLNTFITESYIAAASLPLILISSIGASFIILFFLRKNKIFSTIIKGILFSVFVFALFSIIFIITRTWIDPLIPTLGIFTGSAVSICFMLQRKRMLLAMWKNNFGNALPKNMIKALYKRNITPPFKDIKAENVVVIAVKDSRINKIKLKENAEERVSRRQRFLTFIRKELLNYGCAIVGIKEDTVIAALGSPFETESKTHIKNKNANIELETLVKKALKIINALNSSAQNKINNDIYFGVDAGQCVFAWNALEKLSASGVAASQSALLASYAAQTGNRALLTKAAASRTEDMNVSKISIPNGNRKIMLYSYIPTVPTYP